jgi:hypothetical protein
VRLQRVFSVYITNFLSMLEAGANLRWSVRVKMSHICTVLIVKLLSTVESRSGLGGGGGGDEKADRNRMILLANFILHFQ